MKYYVYVLKYPDGKVFYVGKGTRYRINHHEMEARGEIPTTNPHKVNVIRKIWAGGNDIIKEKIYETLNEKEAYEVEKETIEYYGLSNLTNIIPGGSGGWGADASPEHYLKQSSATRKASSKVWEGFISPFGEEHKNIVNLHEFCKDYNLDYNAMMEIDRDKREHYKGWRKIGSKSFCEDNYDTSVNYNLRLARTYIPSFSLSIDTLPEDMCYNSF